CTSSPFQLFCGVGCKGCRCRWPGAPKVRPWEGQGCSPWCRTANNASAAPTGREAAHSAPLGLEIPRCPPGSKGRTPGYLIAAHLVLRTNGTGGFPAASATNQLQCTTRADPVRS